MIIEPVENRQNGMTQCKELRDSDVLSIIRDTMCDILINEALSATELSALLIAMTFVGHEDNALVHPDSGELLSVAELAELTGRTQEQLREGLLGLRRRGFVSTLHTGGGEDEVGDYLILHPEIAYRGRFVTDEAQVQRARAAIWQTAGFE